MATYTLRLTSLLDHLQSIQRCAKHLALADDVTDAGRIEEIEISWDALLTEGPKYGQYLIVKQHYREYAERIFAGSNIKIPTKGARYFYAVFGDISFKE